MELGKMKQQQKWALAEMSAVWREAWSPLCAGEPHPPFLSLCVLVHKIHALDQTRGFKTFFVLAYFFFFLLHLQPNPQIFSKPFFLENEG